MKLKYEDKKEIYIKWKKGKGIKEISEDYKVDKEVIRYLLKYINRYGIESVKKKKNNRYSKKYKIKIINRVLLEGESIGRVALEHGLTSKGILSNWIASYKKNGYTIVENTIGRPSKMGRKPKKKLEEMTELERLRLENEYLRAETEYLKKLHEYQLKEELLLKQKQKSSQNLEKNIN